METVLETLPEKYDKVYNLLNKSVLWIINKLYSLGKPKNVDRLNCDQ